MSVTDAGIAYMVNDRCCHRLNIALPVQSENRVVIPETENPQEAKRVRPG